MPELLKDKYYNYDSLHDLALRIKAVYPSFQVNDFAGDIMGETWEGLELKARMRQITLNLGNYLPTDYEQALDILNQVVDGYPIGFNGNALIYFPDFVEVYGQDECHWDLSIAAIEKYTQLSTGEFAVRPFIIKHEARMMRQMEAWATHDNEHTDWIVKQGCRTLLKKGNKEVLDIFGYHDASAVDITHFTLDVSSIAFGENLTFSFAVLAKETTKVRLEYEIDYVKTGGKRSRKIFQISVILLKANQKRTYTRTHSFADLSSRRHYPGSHSITLIVNGAERGTLNFELTI